MIASWTRLKRWQVRGQPVTRLSRTGLRALMTVFALAFLITTSACQQTYAAQDAPTLSSTTASIPASASTQASTPKSAPTSRPNTSRNHVHQSGVPARVTFTSSITYEQAVADLQAAGEELYPWNCDDPSTPVPPTTAQQSAAFASSHALFIYSPTIPGLDQLATFAQVVSIDPNPMYMCP